MKPYKLITTDDPTQMLSEGATRHYETCLAACNAFAKAPEPFKQILYDNGHEARELDERERTLLERVCGLLGVEIVDEVDYGDADTTVS